MQEPESSLATLGMTGCVVIGAPCHPEAEGRGTFPLEYEGENATWT